MASTVIYSTRRPNDEHELRSSPWKHQANRCLREPPSQEEFGVQFQQLRDETLPEMERIERMLTRIAIAYGLEYCHLDIVASSFLALSRDISRLLVESRKAVSSDERTSSKLELAKQNTVDSFERFRDVITTDLTCQESTPVYRRLIATLMTFEANMSHVVAVHCSAGDSGAAKLTYSVTTPVPVASYPRGE